MFRDNIPLIDQVSWDGFCDLFRDKKSYVNLVYGNPIMDYVPTLDDLRCVLNDSKVKHLPVKVNRNQTV